MSNPERLTPTPNELKEIFSIPDENVSVVDGLVYTALGFYEDADYIGIVETAVNLGCIDEIAMAEARLEIIQEQYDNREPGYEGYEEENNKNLERTACVDGIVSFFEQADMDRFFEVYEAESQRLRAEQIMVDNGISGQQ